MERDANSKWENLPFPDSQYVTVDVLHEATVSLYVRKDIDIEDFEDAIYLACSNHIDYRKRRNYEILAKWPIWAYRESKVYSLGPTERYAIRELDRDCAYMSDESTETITEEEESEDGDYDNGKCKNFFKK